MYAIRSYYENEPLGTGGAIANAIPYCESDSFFLINGDTFVITSYSIHYTKLYDNNYKSSVIDKIVNGNLSAKEATKYIKQEVENLNTLLSDPTAMTEYYNKLTATIQSEKATAALEEINQKINSQSYNFV